MHLDVLDFEINDFSDKGFWDKMFENLHTSLPANLESNFTIFDIDSNAVELYRTRLIDEGYVQTPHLSWDEWFSNIREAIKLLEHLNIPLPFIFVFCEPWLLASKFHVILENIFGEKYNILPDFWVWHVDPKKRGAGWGPHRDKGPTSLFQNGKPKSLTLWLPLTDATIDNGCMYLLPANRDPTYSSGEINKAQIDLQNIVAVPAGAGSALIWNQAILHWGAKALPRNAAPRISVAFEFQIANVTPFNQPLLKPLTIPNFEIRLKLVCKQILQYAHMYPLQPDIESFAKKEILK